jgi:hypothetical protein
MPRIDQQANHVPGTGGFTYSETPNQRKSWERLEDFIQEMRPKVIPGDTFTLRGHISKFVLNGNAYFTKKVTRDTAEGKKEVDWPYVRVVARITDERIVVGDGTVLELPIKDVGANFFDGRDRKKGTRGTARGGMFHVHLAVTHEEPDEALVNNTGSWETDDYAGPDHPILLRVKFDGYTDNEAYAKQRCGMTLWLAGFERDPDVDPSRTTGATIQRGIRERAAQREATPAPVDTTELDELENPFQEEAPAPKPRKGGAARSAGATATPSAPTGDAPLATDRQRKFIGDLGNEALLTLNEVKAVAAEKFGVADWAALTRAQASQVITYLQELAEE